jgi:hypothetical protein
LVTLAKPTTTFPEEIASKFSTTERGEEPKQTNKENRAEAEVQNVEPEASNNNHNNETKNYLPESLWQILAESPARDVQSSTGGRVPTP